MSHLIHDITVEREQYYDVLDSKLFKTFCEKLVNNNDIHVHGIHIQSVDYFGSRVGFIKCKVNATNNKGNQLPGICFLRGGSVAMLPIIKSGSEYYTLLCSQYRVPAASSIYEVAAGMIDDDHFKGAAAKEMKEELGIDINESQLYNLNELLYGVSNPLYLSPGGSDETMQFYVCHLSLPYSKLIEFNDRQTGLSDEDITLKLVKLDKKTIYKQVHIEDLKTMYMLNTVLSSFDEVVSSIMIDDTNKHKEQLQYYC